MTIKEIQFEELTKDGRTMYHTLTTHSEQDDEKHINTFIVPSEIVFKFFKDIEKYHAGN